MNDIKDIGIEAIVNTTRISLLAPAPVNCSSNCPVIYQTGKRNYQLPPISGPISSLRISLAAQIGVSFLRFAASGPIDLRCSISWSSNPSVSVPCSSDSSILSSVSISLPAECRTRCNSNFIINLRRSGSKLSIAPYNFNEAVVYNFTLIKTS